MTEPSAATRAEPPRSAAGERSLGELLGEVTSDLSQLVRQEVALAKAELKQEASRAGKAAGMLGAAGGAGYFALLFASLTIMFGLAEAMPLWVAALIVTAVYGVVAAVLYARGRAGLKRVNPKPEQTIETIQEDVQWARARKN